MREKRQIIPSRVPPICIGNENINAVATHKVLGVTMDNNLPWTNYVNELTKRIFRNKYTTHEKETLSECSRWKTSFMLTSNPPYASTLC